MLGLETKYTLAALHHYGYRLFNHYHPQVNGTIYFMKIIMLIWQAVIKIWNVHNGHLHPGNPEQEECSQLQTAVNQNFFGAQQGPILQMMVENLDPKQIMA